MPSWEFLGGSLASTSTLPGDHNNHGQVDAADYVAWRNNGGSRPDYDSWRANFGQANASGSRSTAVAIPEPTALAAAALSIAVGFVRRTHLRALP